MMALAGGLVALVLGIIGIVVWWCPLLEILMGVPGHAHSGRGAGHLFRV
jgi:hypothetical protein